MRCTAIALALLWLAPAPAGAARLVASSQQPEPAFGESFTLDLWLEMGEGESLRGVQMTLEVHHTGGTPVFTQVPDLLGGAAMAPWGLSSTITRAFGDPDNFVTVIHANLTDIDLDLLEPLTEFGLELFRGKGLPLGSVTLTRTGASPIFIDLVPERDQLCASEFGDCVLDAPDARVFPVFDVALQDADRDGFPTDDDNCPRISNPQQVDTDGDGVGDACNDGLDRDGDEWNDARDNCRNDANPEQRDVDGDGFGDVCDSRPEVPDDPLGAGSLAVAGGAGGLAGLWRLDADGIEDPALRIPLTAGDTASGFALGSDGRTYLTHPEQMRAAVYAADGSLHEEIVAGLLDRPVDVEVDSLGGLWVLVSARVPRVVHIVPGSRVQNLVFAGPEADGDADGVGDVCDPLPDRADHRAQHCLRTLERCELGPEPAGLCEDDADRDGRAGAVDNCPGWPNADQLDRDGNGRGDACECGDANEDGRINTLDILAVSDSIIGTLPTSPLCDASGDERCNLEDIFAIHEWLTFAQPTHCPRDAGP